MKKRPNLSLTVDNSNHTDDTPKKKPTLTSHLNLNLSSSNPRKSSGLGSQSFNHKRLIISSRSTLTPLHEKAQKKLNTISKRGSLKINKMKITTAGLLTTIAALPVTNAHQIDAKFELLPLVRLGAGASGVVYSAIHIPSLRLVAVKQVPYHDPVSLNQCVQEIKSLKGNHQRVSDCVLRCAAHPSMDRHVGDMMGGKKPAHTTRRCVMCGDIFCGDCKRQFMVSLGSHRWRCKEDCTKDEHQENLDNSKRTKVMLAKLKSLDNRAPEHCTVLDDEARSRRLQYLRAYLMKHPNMEKLLGQGAASHLRKLIKWDASKLMHICCRTIVVLHDAFTDMENSTMNIVMELMDCGSLQDEIDKKETFSIGLLSTIALNILQALIFLHNSGQLHRDIKPANILLNSHGQVKLADFGIAFFDEQNRDATIREKHKGAQKTKRREASAVDFVGTAAYMSPERLDNRKFNQSGSRGYGPPTDIWAFGLTLLACVVGKCPYPVDSGFFELVSSICDDDSPTLDRNEYPDDLCDFLDKCLIKDPANRSTASELLKHPFVQDRYVDRDTYLTKRALDSTLDLKRNLKARAIAFRKICAYVIRRHVTMSMLNYEKRYFSNFSNLEDNTATTETKAMAPSPSSRRDQPRRRILHAVAATALGEQIDQNDHGNESDPRIVAPLPRFDFGLVMGLAEQMELNVSVCFKIAQQEWKLGLQELNIRLEMRDEMEDAGERPRLSSIALEQRNMADLPSVKNVGTPVHLDR